MNNSNFVLLILAAALSAAAVPASGQPRTYPDKPVRIVVPFAPSGSNDIMARHTAQKLAEAFGVPFVVDNRSGAGGAIGSENVARSAPDGHSLLFASTSTMSINPHLSKIQYDPLTSFTPVIMIANSPLVLVVPSPMPVRSIKDVIALAKARPAELTFASSGVGTIIHVTGEMFAQRAGIKLLHIPYKGAGPAAVDTVSGQVTMMFAAYPTVSGQVQAGKLRLLAVTTLSRMGLAPTVPTIAESGLPGFEANQWWAVSGPSAMPAAVVGRLNGELNRILRTDDIKKRFAVEGAEPGGGSSTELAAYIKNDFERWGAVIRDIGLKAE